MTISTTDPEAYARQRLADILRTGAEDRAAFAVRAATVHPDVIAVSTGKPVPPDPPPEVFGPPNRHPGPDFDLAVSA